MKAVLIFCALCVLTLGSKGEEKCSAIDNRWWDKTRERCRRCRGCVSGKARNFTEQYMGPTGLEGDYGCLPCQTPPPGFYINIYSDRSPPEFVKCKDCTGLHRNTDVSCEATHDRSCGGCFRGFEDVFGGNTDLQCVAKTTTTFKTSSLPTPHITTLQAIKRLIPTAAEPLDNRGSAPSIEKGGVSHYAVLVISCVLGATVFVTSTVVITYRRKRIPCKKTVPYVEENQTLNDNDIEMDTFPQTTQENRNQEGSIGIVDETRLENDSSCLTQKPDHDVIITTANALVRSSPNIPSSGAQKAGRSNSVLVKQKLIEPIAYIAVKTRHDTHNRAQVHSRGSTKSKVSSVNTLDWNHTRLSSGRVKDISTPHEVEPLLENTASCPEMQELVRGELRHSISSQPDARVPHDYLQQTTDNLMKPLKLAKLWSRICRCDSIRMKCPKTNYSHVSLVDRNDILEIVANEICHDPLYLFKAIKVPDAVFYQIYNDRDRDPERMSQNECDYKVLQRWVQAKGKEANLQVLIEGLHSAQFYHIIERVTQLEDHDLTHVKEISQTSTV